MSFLRTREADARDRFAGDIANHVLTVKHDDGLHRHLLLSEPGTSVYWFEIVTWPGTLTIHGDMGTHVFSRVADMFSFFRRTAAGINTTYWSEKLQATSGAQKFDADLLRTLVMEEITERTEDLPRERAERRDELVEAVTRDVLDDDELDENEAHRRLRDFEHDGFEFYDTYEWDLKGYESRYLWCLHAIVHAINLYDEHHIDIYSDVILQHIHPGQAVSLSPEQRRDLAALTYRGGWTIDQLADAIYDNSIHLLAAALCIIPAPPAPWTLQPHKVATARLYAHIARALHLRAIARFLSTRLLSTAGAAPTPDTTDTNTALAAEPKETA